MVVFLSLCETEENQCCNLRLDTHIIVTSPTDCKPTLRNVGHSFASGVFGISQHKHLSKTKSMTVPSLAMQRTV